MRYGLHLTLALAALGALTASSALGAPVRAGQNPQVEMTIARRGKLTIELYQKAAPKTVEHFLALVNKGFYNGIKFHRVRPGFVAQAGDPVTRDMSSAEIAPLTDFGSNPKGVGSHGSGKAIPFEKNSYTHEVGTLAMALSGPRSATGDSQFFINLVPNHMLDGDYCVFGKVVKGMDVVNKIQQGDAITRITPIKRK